MDNLSISFDFRTNLLKIETEGEMSFTDFILIINIVKEADFLKKDRLKLLLDLRQTMAAISEDELKKLVLPFSDMVSKFKHVQMAELVANPNETALALLFNTDSQFIPNLDYELFSLPKTANFWLQKSSS